MEDVSKTELIVKHLNALYAARKTFIVAESNEMLRRALKAKNRVTTEITYDVGDIVYYKRNDSNKWEGPRKVIGKEDKQILLKHIGYYIKVNPCSLKLVDNIGSKKSVGTPGNINVGEFMAGTEEKK